MTHTDDDGLVLPPRLAPAHVVILPVMPQATTRARKVLEYCDAARATSCARSASTAAPIEVEVDERDLRGGDKSWEWVKKGVPLRIEVGPRDVDGGARVAGAPRPRRQGQGEHAARRVRRATSRRSSTRCRRACFAQARAFRDENTRRHRRSRGEFDAFFTPKNEDKPEIHGGFALSHWCGDAACETAVKDALKVTIRCIPTVRLRGAVGRRGQEPGHVHLHRRAQRAARDLREDLLSHPQPASAARTAVSKSMSAGSLPSACSFRPPPRPPAAAASRFRNAPQSKSDALRPASATAPAAESAAHCARRRARSSRPSRDRRAPRPRRPRR